MLIPEISEQLIELGDLLRKNKYMLGTAESCTGGLISAVLTDVSGSSDWFSGTIVSYSNEVKQQLLHVPHTILVEHGAVSEATALAMARGAKKILGVDVTAAVTGIAGPTGGSKDKPVGTVWMGFAVGDTVFAAHHHFSGDRATVRKQTVITVVETLLKTLQTA